MQWIEGVTNIKELVKALATSITQPGEDFWTLVYPASTGEIENKAIISTKPFINEEEPDESEFYLKIERPIVNELTEGDETETQEANQELAMNYIEATIGNKLNDTKDDFERDYHSETARFAFYRDITGKEDDIYYGDWLPIYYYLNIDAKTLNLVIQGDPSVDIHPYNNFLTSWLYAGAIDGYEGGDKDTVGNFALTVGSDIEPHYSKRFGVKTATGVTDICMVYTRAGAPYQAHYPVFYAANPWMDKHFIKGSGWTHKRHISDITVVHPYDRERGKMRNMLIGDASALEHDAELTMDKGTEEEKVYQFFTINTPYWLVNNSANPLYGILLRKK